MIPVHLNTGRRESTGPLLPRFQAYTREDLLWDAYCSFVAGFRTAAAKLKAGDRAAPFPAGSFPPALPYVTA